MNATSFTIPSRVEAELLRKQDARTEWMIEAAAYVKRCRTVDRLSGIDWAIAASEREVADYMDRHPNASWSDAYDRTADRAYDRMRDEMADAADMARMRAKDGDLQ